MIINQRPATPKSEIRPPPQKPQPFPYNSAHEVGTCAKCGQEMRFNSPRLGPNGGYVHKDTGEYDCQTKTNNAAQGRPTNREDVP